MGYTPSDAITTTSAQNFLESAWQILKGMDDDEAPPRLQKNMDGLYNAMFATVQGYFISHAMAFAETHQE